MAFYLDTNKKTAINKCVRFPRTVIEEINKVAEKNNITFSSFVIQACEYALKDMDIKTKKVKTKN